MNKIIAVDNLRPSELDGILIIEFDVHYKNGQIQHRYTKAYNSSTKPEDLLRQVKNFVEYGLKNQESLINYGDVKFW